MCHILSWSQPTISRTLLMLKNTDTYSKQWVNTCYSTGRTWKLVSLSTAHAHVCECCHFTYPICTHTHTRLTALFSGTTQVSWYQKGKTNLDFTEARDSEWQWHQLGHMQVCTSLQTDNHASTTTTQFLQAGCPFCRPTNSVKALKGRYPICTCNVK